MPAELSEAVTRGSDKHAHTVSLSIYAFAGPRNPRV